MNIHYNQNKLLNPPKTLFYDGVSSQHIVGWSVLVEMDVVLIIHHDHKPCSENKVGWG